MNSASVHKIDRRAPTAVGLSLARVVGIAGAAYVVALTDGSEHRARLGLGVQPEIVARCIEEGRMVVVAPDENGELTLWGTLQTSEVGVAGVEDLHLSGKRVVIEATEHLVLRAGQASLRLGRDGVVRMAGRKMTMAMARVFRVLSSLVELP